MHPRRPLAVSPTPACIHPQVLLLPSSTSLSLFLLLYTIAVCSMIILRFFLQFSSKLCAPHIISHMFPVLFVPLFPVNDSFIFLLLRRVQGGSFLLTTCNTLYFILYSFTLFFYLPFFILIVGCSSL